MELEAETDYRKLDYFLKSKGISRRIITKLKFQEGLLINGIPSTTIHPVAKGDKITLRFLQEDTLSCKPQKGPLSILYEDADLLAVNKPPKMATHPALGTKENTLGNYISQYYMDNDSPMPFRPVSRLDKETGGVIIVAKHSFAHSVLSEQMQTNLFQKKYLALTEGVFQKDSGEIIHPIARESEQSLRRVCREDGKYAHTIYRVLTHNETTSLVELELKTGRTHQIRVHLNAIGHPIIGDPLYGTVTGDRLYLHSYQTIFRHPITGERITITAPCDFETLL
ncbi:MAG: RluA family pseudouridine synthase [Clostridia bacterium]|nr:RluA family pseudouridine synthase [Clostridia bacterium]